MSDILHSVVIPCARPERLPELIAALGRQSVETARMEIIVATPRRVALELPAGEAELVWVVTGELFPPGRMRNLGAARRRPNVSSCAATLRASAPARSGSQ